MWLLEVNRIPGAKQTTCVVESPRKPPLRPQQLPESSRVTSQEFYGVFSSALTLSNFSEDPVSIYSVSIIVDSALMAVTLSLSGV